MVNMIGGKKKILFLYIDWINIKLMKTDSTSWSQLSAEIDQYSRRAKLKLEKYEKKRFNCLYKKKKQKTEDSLSLDEMPRRLGYSINLIRQWQRNQNEETSKILNKLSFLKVQRDRTFQSSDRARNKLSRVLSIRSSSSIQKKINQNEINENHQRTIETKKMQSQRVREEKANIQVERKKILSLNSSKARLVRSETILNEQSIKQEREEDVKNKQKSVQKGQAQYEAQLKKLRDRQNAMIEAGKSNHYNYIRVQFMKYQMTKKVKEEVLSRFRNQSQRIIEQTERAREELETFEAMLMLRKKARAISRKCSELQQVETPETQPMSQQNSVQKLKKKVNNFFHLTN